MDDNGSGTLDLNEFRKGISDFQIEIDSKDVDGLFKAFDVDGCGEIRYDEFVRVVVGHLGQARVRPHQPCEPPSSPSHHHHVV